MSISGSEMDEHIVPHPAILIIIKGGMMNSITALITIATTVQMVSHCYPLEATMMDIDAVPPPASAQERAPVVGSLVMTTWRLHSLLPERRVPVEAAVKEAEVRVAEAEEVVPTEVRNEASPYELCVYYARHCTFCSEIRHYER